jgi:hypothetical protein
MPDSIHVEIIFDEYSGWCVADVFPGPNGLSYFERSQYDLVMPTWHPAPMTLLPEAQLERLANPRRFPPGIKLMAVVQHIAQRFSQSRSTLSWIHLWNWLFQAVRSYNNTPIASFPNLGLTPQQYMDKYRLQVEALGANSFDQAYAISRCKPPRLGEVVMWNELELRRKQRGSERRRRSRADYEPITFDVAGAGKLTVREYFRLARQRKETCELRNPPPLSQAS